MNHFCAVAGLVTIVTSDGSNYRQSPQLKSRHNGHGNARKDNFMGSCALSLLEICSFGAPKLEKRCAKLRQLVEEKCPGMSCGNRREEDMHNHID